MTERESQPSDDFMTADLAWAFRDGADDSDSEWLLKTAVAIVESACTAHGFEDWSCSSAARRSTLRWFSAPLTF